MPTYEEIESDGVPIKAWVRGVPLADNARAQLRNAARLPFVHSHLAVMPDVHWGIGATIGSVIPTVGAIVPAAVGVDIGCGMCAVQTTLGAGDLPDNLKGVRAKIERAVPHGRTKGRDRGAWHDVPRRVGNVWKERLRARFEDLCERYPALQKTNNRRAPRHARHGQPLHRGVPRRGGPRVVHAALGLARRRQTASRASSSSAPSGTWSTTSAACRTRTSPTCGRARRRSTTTSRASSGAQDFASLNRRLMMESVVAAVRQVGGLPRFEADVMAVDCHHNYVARETHFGAECLVTRKGAVRARPDDLGIIPGSMGAKSYIVRGKGHPDSFHSCSHGAGRAMSRGAAKRSFSLDDHARATAHVECRKDEAVLDETPMAYKDIDAVMAAQAELVDVVHTLRQVVCVKG